MRNAPLSPEIPPLFRSLADPDTIALLVCRPFYLLAFDRHQPSGRSAQLAEEEKLRSQRRARAAACALQEIFDLAKEPGPIPSRAIDNSHQRQAEEAIAAAQQQVAHKLAELCRAAGLPTLPFAPGKLEAALDELLAGPPSAGESWQHRLDRIGNAAAKEINDIASRIITPQVRKKLAGYGDAAADEVSQAALTRVFAEIGGFDPREMVFGQRVSIVTRWVVGDFFDEQKRRAKTLRLPDEAVLEPAHNGVLPCDQPGFFAATSVAPALSIDWDFHGLRSARPPYQLPSADFTTSELHLLTLMRRLAKDDSEIIQDGADIKFLELCWHDAPRGGRPVDDDGRKIPSIFQRIAQAHPTIKNTDTLKQRARRYWADYRQPLWNFLG